MQVGRFGWLAAAVLMMPAAAQAQSFYENKTVTILVGLAPAGGYDVYARFFARHFGRHIPGNPKIVVENKPGAATATATAYVYHNAPKDGTVVGMSLDILPLYQAIFPERVNFDMSKVQWIGNMATLNSVLAMSNRSPVKTVEDMTRHSAAVGSNGVLSQTYIIPALLNAFNGAKFKIVLGFPGTAQMDLAIDRGEIDGRGGQWNAFVVSRPEWISSGKIIPMIQIGLDDDPHMKGTPQLTSLAKDEKARVIYRNISGIARMSRAMWLAPEVPADRVAILRKAFSATMKDPEFLAETSKSKLEITPTSPEDIQASAKELATMPKEYIDVLRGILDDRKK
jgi:tripartite-type tricarboxylate transporter receptor subunit TctC